MIRITDISFSIDGRKLLDGASAVIPHGHKVGIVGRNGTGKTTLFRLITGELTLDDGSIEFPKQARIGGVAQEAPASDVSLIDTVLAADTERAELLTRAETATDANEIAAIYERLGDIDSYSAEARAAAILSGLGFDTEAQHRACSEFSGGWRMRVALAAVLFSAPDILLLDEPTNYLDLEGTIWLEQYLAKYPHTVLLISHDRGLLNTSVNHILHLQSRALTLYAGGYDTFDATRRAKLAQNMAAAKKQDAAKAHLQSFVDRFRYKASKAKQAQSRLKMIEKMEPIAAQLEGAVAGFSFENADELSPPILRLEDAAVGYDGAPILSRLNLRIDPGDRIALLGANGQGKSTFAKLITGRLDAMSGQITKSSKLRIGYFAQHQVEDLIPEETPLQHLARERPGVTPAKLRAILANGGLGAEQVDVSVSRLSGGQKARLAMLLATLDAPQLVILDEPTNHLDIESRDALTLALADYEGALILVSHDPHLVASTADTLWLVSGGTVQSYDGDMDSYKALLLAERGIKDRKKSVAAPKPKRLSATELRKKLAPLQAEVTKCEQRITTLEEMKSKLETRLADPDFYASDDAGKIQDLNVKHAEILEAMDRAEALWLTAQDKLDAAREAGG